MWIAIEAVNEDDVDQSPTDGGIDLCEAETTDLWNARGCLAKVSTRGEGRIVGRGKAGTYHHGHANGNAEGLRRNLLSRCI